MKLPLTAPHMTPVLERVTYRNEHFGLARYEFITPHEHTHRWTADSLPGKWFATYWQMRCAVIHGLHSLSSIELSGHNMQIGTQEQLKVVAKDAAGNVISTPLNFGFGDDASSVATVDANGLVTPVGLGSVDFTATFTLPDGTVVTSNVLTLTVDAGAVASLELSDAGPVTPVVPVPVATA